MSQYALKRLAANIQKFKGAVNYQPLSRSPVLLKTFERYSSDGVKDNVNKQKFDESILEFLVCPLSKKPLRYQEQTNELINEELGIAYPIIDGIPNMIPQDARLIQKTKDAPEETTQS
ncbi:protein preY, mitochondrial [Chanos chanos]|uniref:Protein preY, mitochondrial n=1 Tax=Chanos chanos TaxID=29144 RepID=A0A6J2VN63_CHACN|nr:protein preY, mitochondrial [Chanos chanos]